MRVLVIGATGPLGREITRAVLGRSVYDVTAMVRQPTAFEMQHQNLTVVQGDVLDTNSLDRAMAGQEAVIASLGVKITRKPVTLFSEGTSNILRCMQRHNARRFICITGIGAGDSKGHGGWLYNNVVQPLLLKTIYEDKTRQEELIRFCDRDWCVVRPATLTNGPAKGEYAMIRDIRAVQATTISRADVAAFCADQLRSNKFLYQYPILSDQ